MGLLCSGEAQQLLRHCAKWIGDVDLDQEMPKIQFHVAGANGHTKKRLDPILENGHR